MGEWCDAFSLVELVGDVEYYRTKDALVAGKRVGRMKLFARFNPFVSVEAVERGLDELMGWGRERRFLFAA